MLCLQKENDKAMSLFNMIKKRKKEVFYEPDSNYINISGICHYHVCYREDSTRSDMPETLWHCHVKEFGPLIVSIDSYGRNYFEEKKVEYNKKKDEQVEIISKQVGFIK